MEILIEPARCRDRGTLIVPIASDGTLGTVAAGLDRASGGLVGRALAAGRGRGSSTVGSSICCFPPA